MILMKDKELKILIPGCGNAYEAEYLFENGFTNVFIIEISKQAILSFSKRCPLFPIQNIIHADFFDLMDSFDLIIEQTFFCAIQPNLRNDYVSHMTNLLKPNGKLVGLMFHAELYSEHPPFGGYKEEYEALFKPHFNTVKMEITAESIKEREGRELFIEIYS